MQNRLCPPDFFPQYFDLSNCNLISYACELFLWQLIFFFVLQYNECFKATRRRTYGHVKKRKCHHVLVGIRDI